MARRVIEGAYSKSVKLDKKSSIKHCEKCIQRIASANGFIRIPSVAAAAILS